MMGAEPQSPGRPRDRAFYSGMAAAILAGVFVGFAPSYYLKGTFRPALPPLSPLVHLHGAAFTCWVLLFVTQAVLVARGRVEVHRRLGVAGAGVVHDLWSRRRVHPVYLWAGSLFVAPQALRLWLSQSDAWRAFARALIQ